ncbi:MAG TPA: pyridoxal phosphate-dependent aminotransferase [Clostridiales bacterium]|nr:pyridoxal phosphate-dependent aminotransferase [Clostridiales bacterium]
MVLSKKAQAISGSITLAITAKEKAMKAEGIDVIGFGAGEPDFDTPLHVKQEAIRAINQDYTRYTPVSGILPLRKAICDKLKRDNSLEYNPSEIVVSNGAKHSLFNIFQAILNPGDEVLIPSPYWVSYPELVKLADGVPVFVNTKEDNLFKVRVRDLERAVTPKTKALILNSPSNPNGCVYKKEELMDIADFAVKNDIFVISDEIYEKLIYDGKEHISIAALNDKIKDRTIVVNGVSKAYAMTGWRIGYTASNQEIASVMNNIQSHATSNPNSIAQYASIAALNGPQDCLYEMVKEFQKRRDYMVKKINSIEGLSCRKPMGAFYVMVNISKTFNRRIDDYTINSSIDFAEALLSKSKVAVVPGISFGDDNFIRLSYATSMEKIKEGLNRIEQFIKNLTE